MIDPDVALTYLDFVAERHRVWERRRTEPGPWTEDPILQTHKFTNVFRVIDYGSQFLVTDLLEPDLSPRDTLARCFLYRFTNLPKTWMDVREILGRYPLADDFNDDLIEILRGLHKAGTIFSGAYMIRPPFRNGDDKIRQIVEFTAGVFATTYVDDFLAAPDQPARFKALTSTPSVGQFMGMQILTDWGYSPLVEEDRENEFIIPGPGCVMGAKFIDPDARPEQTLEWAVDAVRSMPDCPTLPLDGGGYREPSLMDVQNTLCEYSKYHRYAARWTGRKAPYVPQHPGPQPDLALPAHWS